MEDGGEIKVDEDLARRTAREMGIDLRHLIVLHAGFDRHLSKPVDPDALREILS